MRRGIVAIVDGILEKVRGGQALLVSGDKPSTLSKAFQQAIEQISCDLILAGGGCFIHQGLLKRKKEVYMLQLEGAKIVLASGSSGRAALLRGAGISFTKNPADLDERAIEEALTIDGVRPDPVDVAAVLARAKAEHISQREPDAYVIGADQVLALGDEIFEKPATMDIARNNLLKFRGRTHYLHAAICVCRNGETIWEHGESAAMSMRNFTIDFLAQYLVEAGDSVQTSVGAYRLEETGIHLFEKIDGDYFTILGLPLIPLLDFFRTQNIILD